MARVVVHLHGKPKDVGARNMIEMYAQRISSYGAGVVFHPGRQTALQFEERISSIDGDVMILDEAGQQMTSKEFAGVIQGTTISGRTLNLIVGPADGFSSTIKARFSSISLSMMTYPHEIAAVMLLEQIYRAYEINRGSPYHRE